MTLRIKKSDLDAFAKGRSDFDEFQNKVATHAYAGYGYGITSLNSWLKKVRDENSSTRLPR